MYTLLSIRHWTHIITLWIVRISMYSGWLLMLSTMKYSILQIASIMLHNSLSIQLNESCLSNNSKSHFIVFELLRYKCLYTIFRYNVVNIYYFLLKSVFLRISCFKLDSKGKRNNLSRAEYSFFVISFTCS